MRFSPNSSPLIAVVDDEPTICDLLEELLTDEGYQVACYAGRDGLFEGIALQLPGLLILDLHLGRVDGWEVLADLRRLPGGDTVPVILMTADTHAAQHHSEELREQNTVILGKPFEIGNLLDLITLALGGKRQVGS